MNSKKDVAKLVKQLQDEIDNCTCEHFPTPLAWYGDNCSKCASLRAQLRIATARAALAKAEGRDA